MIATNRTQAELNSKRTLAALHKAEDTSEVAYLNAKRAHDISVSELVSFQISNPTPKEFKRSENTLRLRNRGLDV